MAEPGAAMSAAMVTHWVCQPGCERCDARSSQSGQWLAVSPQWGAHRVAPGSSMDQFVDC
jgi:hypothetical protein